MKHFRKSWFNLGTLGLLVLLGILFFMIVLPLGHLLVRSLKIERPGIYSYWSLANYIYTFMTPKVFWALKNTLYISSGAAFLATCFGVTLAVIVGRTNVPWRNFLDMANLIPFYIPPLVGAIAWRIILSPKVGLFNEVFSRLFPGKGHLFNIYSLWGMMFVIGLFYTPYVYLFAIGPLKNIDSSLEESARVSGAGWIRTIMSVTLPLVTPAILSGSILVFVSSAGLFGVPLLLGAPFGHDTLTTLIYTSVNQYPANFNLAAAMGTVLFVLTFVCLVIRRWIMSGKSYTTVTGKGAHPEILSLGCWRYPALLWNLCFLFFAVFIPVAVLLCISFFEVWEGGFRFAKLSLRNYNYIFFTDITSLTGIKNSLFLSITGATIGTLFCLILSNVIYRSKVFGRSIVNIIAILPVATPGLVLGLGCLIAWINTPLYGTIWILLIGYIARFIPFGERNISASLVSIAEELAESARLSGSGWLATLCFITFPLLRQGLLATWVLLFIIFIQEVSVSMMLSVYGTETMAIAMVRMMDYEPYGVAGAYSIVQMVILIFAVFLFRKLCGMDKLSMVR